MDVPSAGALGSLPLTDLERLFRDAPLGPTPNGRFLGRFLSWLPTRGARKAHVRAMDWLLFQRLRFGIDFDRDRWWFVTPALVVGRFEATPGPSRWRDTDVYRLAYGPSRLPRPIRAALYDEVKPLSDGVCLGIGGLNADAGDGDHFLFSLERIG
jgi:hypothetical protein